MSHWVVTGGAGYVGAHVVSAMLASGRDVTVVDDLSTGDARRVDRRATLVRATVTDEAALVDTLRAARAIGVIHLAGKKSPTESVRDPLLYARENAGGVTALLGAVRAADLPAVVFSSSCSVYGTPATSPVDEGAATVPESPYGESKLYGERLLHAASSAYGLGTISLRYFNVVGAASPVMADTGAFNLVPRTFSALERGDSPEVYGTDHDTPDGTCVRDYVDVRDVASAHVRSVEALEEGPRRAVYNVGRGQGTSVLQLLDVVRAVSGRSFSPRVRPRRPGDPSHVVGSVERIGTELGWRAQHDLVDAVSSAWSARAQLSPDP